jgi:hypothetical protein
VNKRVHTAHGVRIINKNPNGAGSVYQQADGRWCATWRQPGDPTRHKATATTRQHAIDRRADRMMEAGICPICEHRHVTAGDVMCSTCRAWVDENTTDITTDPVERILNTHQPIYLDDYGRLCLCGQAFDSPAPYRRHVADLIYSALHIDRPEENHGDG